MKRIIRIKGMSCSHCQARVEKALNSVEGVKAKVDLKKEQATVIAEEAITEETLRSVIEEAGYEVVSIEEKRGFFG